MTNKIIRTVFISIFMYIILFFTSNYFIGFINGDDEIMFCAGLTLIVIVCFVVALFFFAVVITEIWDKDKKNKRK